MTNRTALESKSAWLLAACACGSLGGCVAAVVPIAASGLIGRSATHRHAHRQHPPVAAPTRTPAQAPAVTPTARVPAVVAPIAVATPTPPPAFETITPPPPPPPPTIAAPGTPPADRTATTWDDVVQYMAKLVLLPPERSRSSVLRSPDDASNASCDAAPSAVVVDAATLGRDDYVDLGAIHTMGYEIAFTSIAPRLPAAQIGALAKVGIAAPIRRETLFLAPPGGEKAARAAIAARYCVVGIVGNYAADFPGPIVPRAHAGWFLIAKP